MESTTTVRNQFASKHSNINQKIHTIDCNEKHDQVRFTIQDHSRAGEWFLKNPTYNSWKAGSSSSLFVLMGPAGTGKTVLSSVVIEDIKRSQKHTDSALVFFYCDSANCASTTIFQNLLIQLHKLRPTNATFALSETTDIPSLLLELAGEHGQADDFIVIDSLDECEDLTPSVFQTLSHLATKFKIFVTSRVQSDSMENFQNSVQVKISPEDVSEDLKEFVEKQVKRMKIQDPAFADELVLKLVSDAQGSFLWPLYLLPQLQGLDTDDAIRQALPQGTDIDTLYKLLSVDHRRASSERARHVLRLVLGAFRPLKLAELADGLATFNMDHTWDPSRVASNPEHLINSCADLFTCDLDSKSLVVSPFSPDLKEFLLAGPTKLTGSLVKYSLHPLADVHNDIAKLCLSYVRLRTKVLNDSDTALTDDSFASYAVSHLHDHIRASGSDALAPDFKEFFSPESETIKTWKRLYETITNQDPQASDRIDMEEQLERISAAHIAVLLDLPVMIPHFTKGELMAEDHRGFNTLHVAIELSRSPTMIETLIQTGVNVNQVSGSGSTNRTPLHLLMSYPQRDAVSCAALLLQHGAKPDTPDAEGNTAIHVAAAAVEYVFSRDFSEPGDDESEAIGYSHIYLELLQILVAKGANLHCKNKKGDTPLHAAAGYSIAFAVEFLLQNGLEVDACNEEGSTPLHNAVANMTSHQDRETTVKHLLNHNANVHAQTTEKQWKPLHLAASSQCPRSVFDLLFESGARVDCRDVDFATPLHLAAKVAPVLNAFRSENYWRVSWIAFRQIVHHLLDKMEKLLDDYDLRALRGVVNQVPRLFLINYSYILDSFVYEFKDSEPDHPAVTWFKDVIEIFCTNGATLDARDKKDCNILQYMVDFWASWISEHHKALLSEWWVKGESSICVAYAAWTRIAKESMPDPDGDLINDHDTYA